uniref:DUF7869 domain-containing protein n=1 Tax=Branchiostoma floridae TaxID=7739 RepID=C3Y8M6_BRAFL|eukprot:XP_002607453.1 hypothetical protein BRAFLDRAFT_69878 [Branchiostoma floridae]
MERKEYHCKKCRVHGVKVPQEKCPWEKCGCQHVHDGRAMTAAEVIGIANLTRKGRPVTDSATAKTSRRQEARGVRNTEMYRVAEAPNTNADGGQDLPFPGGFMETDHVFDILILSDRHELRMAEKLSPQGDADFGVLFDADTINSPDASDSMGIDQSADVNDTVVEYGFENNYRLLRFQTQVTGAISHGERKAFARLDHMEYPHDTNLTLNFVTEDVHQLEEKFTSAIRGFLVENFQAFSGVKHTAPAQRWINIFIQAVRVAD